MRLAVLPFGTARPLGAAPATAIAASTPACISTTHGKLLHTSMSVFHRHPPRCAAWAAGPP